LNKLLSKPTKVFTSSQHLIFRESHNTDYSLLEKQTKKKHLQ